MKRKKTTTKEDDKVYMMELSAPKPRIHLVFNLQDLIKLCKTCTLYEGDVIVLSPVKCVYTVTVPAHLPSIDALTLISNPGASKKDIQAAWFAPAPTIKDTKSYSDAVYESLRNAGIRL